MSKMSEKIVLERKIFGAGSYSIAMSNEESSTVINDGIYCISASVGNDSATDARGHHAVSVNTGEHSHARAERPRSVAVNVGGNSIALNRGERSLAFCNGWGSLANVEGKQSLAINFAPDGKVKGCIGSWIALAEWSEGVGIADIKIKKVDGENILADTVYKLENGEFVAAED